MVPIPLKNIKPIIILRRLMGNEMSLSSKNLKYHVSGQETSCIPTHLVVFELCGILIKKNMFHI